MSDILEINRLGLRCQVGFNSHEVGKLQEIDVTIRLYVNTTDAGQSDAVSKCTDVKRLCKDVIKLVEGKAYNLIEAVANDVAYLSLLQHAVRSVEIRVEKPNALRFSKYSAITIRRTLDDYKKYNVIVSIGANINPEKNVPECIRKISQTIGKIECLSRCYATPPINSSHETALDVGNFLNVAVETSTYLDQTKLKEKLLDVEKEFGRVRDPNDKYAPRPIDLDITYFSSYEDPQNTWVDVEDVKRFAHVIVPLSDIKPDFTHDLVGMSFLSLARKITNMDTPSNFFPKVDLNLAGICDAFKEVKQIDGCAPGNIDTTRGYVKSALVTGGASKIGQYITRELHSEGYNVAIHYCDRAEVAEEIAKELNDIRNDSAILIQGDFSSASQTSATKIIETVVNKWNRIDLLVNNASIFVETKVEDCSEDSWNATFNTNLTFPFFLIQASSNYLKQVYGTVVNICDVHGERPMENHSAYSVSKAGLIALTKSMAKDLGRHGVRVNGVNPGAIFWNDDKHDDEYKNVTLSKTALKRAGRPDDIAKTVLFLANSSYIAGQIINVDGGRTVNQ